MTRIYSWRVECTPIEKGSIRLMTLFVEAETRKEAELIVLDRAHRFFDQDIIYMWGKPIEGYRKSD